MADSPYIHDVTHETFESLVILASQQAPVLVDFWAPWCQPCQMLSPILEKLANDYAGRFTVAKINTDEEQFLAQQLGVRGLPTCLLVKDGQPVDQFVGMQPEPAIREMLDRHVAPAEAAPAENVPPPPASLESLREALANNPEDHTARIELAGVLTQQGATAEAQELLRELPANEQETDAAKTVLARLQFIDSVADAPPLDALQNTVANDPTDLRARYYLGTRQLLAGRASAALEQFLEIMKRDHSFEEKLGQRSLIDAFKLIDDAPLVSQYRKQMSRLLF